MMEMMRHCQCPMSHILDPFQHCFRGLWCTQEGRGGVMQTWGTRPKWTATFHEVAFNSSAAALYSHKDLFFPSFHQKWGPKSRGALFTNESVNVINPQNTQWSQDSCCGVKSLYLQPSLIQCIPLSDRYSNFYPSVIKGTLLCVLLLCCR